MGFKEELITLSGELGDELELGGSTSRTRRPHRQPQRLRG